MKGKGYKVVFAFLAISILLILINLYTSLNGNPLRIYRTMLEAEKYLAAQYPAVQFTDVRGSYNPKQSSYEVRAVALLDEPVQIRVVPKRENGFYDDLFYKVLSEPAQKEVAPLVQKTLPHLEFEHISVSWGIDSPGCTGEIAFTKDIPFQLVAPVKWVGGPVTKEVFLNEALSVYRILHEEGYKVTSFHFAYLFEKEARESLVVDIKREDLGLSFEQLLNNVSHYVGK